MTGADGGFVVGAFELDAVFGWRDRRALSGSCGIAHRALIGAVVTVADDIFKLVIKLFAAAVLVFHLPGIQLGLGEDRANTHHAAIGCQGAVFGGRGDAVLALFAGVVAVLVDKVMILACIWCRNTAACAVGTPGIGRAPDGELGAFLQCGFAVVPRLGLIDIGWRIVEGVDADLDKRCSAFACLVGGVATWRVGIGVGVVGGARHVLVVKRHDGENIGVVFAAVVFVGQLAAI